MLSLVFDTETTGVFDYRSPAGSLHQPDVVQIAAILADDEKIYAKMNVLVHTETDIPETAFEIHRIDRRLTAMAGISRTRACQMLHSLATKADVIVGHNIEFDIKIMTTAFIREGGNGTCLQKPTYCTMKKGTDICKIPNPNPKFKGYKWPKLQEIYKVLIHPDGFDGAHDALADVEATYEVYRVLRSHTG